VLVANFGIDQAEGFLHSFEGWIVFMTCIAILFLEMWLLAKLNGRKLMDAFGLDVPPLDTLRGLLPTGKVKPQLLASLVVLLLAGVATAGLEKRQNRIPDRQSFNTFPLVIGDWRGRDHLIEDQAVLDSLAADDYLLAEYRSVNDGSRVGMWVAYYAEQRKGRAVHSPRACLPGGGWKIESLGQHLIEDVGPAGEDILINRSVIAKGEEKQVVYYWFLERGRIQTNEYMVKWSIFWDALTLNRTEGALVRFTTFVPDVSHIEDADRRLTEFIKAVDPKLAYFLPQKDTTFQETQAAL
jgi:exosortase D (VPLPA-CTERM-specific)